MKYEEGSFEQEAEELLGAVAEELEDVAGWAFILWCRVRALREAVGDGDSYEPKTGHEPYEQALSLKDIDKAIGVPQIGDLLLP